MECVKDEEKREKKTRKLFSPLGVVFLICISDNSEHLDSCHLRKACSWQSTTIYDNIPYLRMTGLASVLCKPSQSSL